MKDKVSLADVTVYSPPDATVPSGSRITVPSGGVTFVFTGSSPGTPRFTKPSENTSPLAPASVRSVSPCLVLTWAPEGPVSTVPGVSG